MRYSDTENKNGLAVCICSQETGLFVRNRELSYGIALCLFVLFFVFMAGFYWGKQQAVKDFLHGIDRNAFSDNVSFSLYSLNKQHENHKNIVRDASDIFENSDNNDSSDYDSNDGDSCDSGDSDKVVSVVLDETNDTNDAECAQDNSQFPVVQYHAQLIGFGTASAAEQFANHVAKRGFSVKVKKRRSNTAKGKRIQWYQVVTDNYSDKDYLEKVVDILARQEKLGNVRIVSTVQ